MILCSYSDGFVMEQDACAMCGSFEPDQEGRLISCPQCEQVYFFFLVNNKEIVSSLALFLIQCHHPFCANVRLTKVIYKKDDVASISNSLTNSILCDVLLTMCNFFFYDSTVRRLGRASRLSPFVVVRHLVQHVLHGIHSTTPPPQGNCTFSFSVDFFPRRTR